MFIARCVQLPWFPCPPQLSFWAKSLSRFQLDGLGSAPLCHALGAEVVLAGAGAPGLPPGPGVLFLDVGVPRPLSCSSSVPCPGSPAPESQSHNVDKKLL